MFGKRKPKKERPRRRRKVMPPNTPKAGADPKGLDAPDVIDRVLSGPNGEARLLIMHGRPWAEGDHALLKRKVVAYLAYFEHGQVDESNPNWFQAESMIQLVHRRRSFTARIGRAPAAGHSQHSSLCFESAFGKPIQRDKSKICVCVPMFTMWRSTSGAAAPAEFTLTDVTWTE